jgi:hypothetical protein
MGEKKNAYEFGRNTKRKEIILKTSALMEG